jgi:threonine/homoserine/homoserine lactone efflux protein
MLTACLTFAAVAALVTITPGLDTMLVLRTAITSGRRVGFLAGVGVGTGCLAWAVAGAVGLTAVLAASSFAFEALRLAGAGYLLWLGGQALWHTRGAAHGRGAADATADATADFPVAAATPAAISGRTALRTGLATNLLNPKIGVFYMSLLPQFVPHGASVLWTSLLFAVIHDVEGLLWFTLIVFAASAARRTLSHPAVKRRLQQLTGLAFIAFGLRLATDR